MSDEGSDSLSPEEQAAMDTALSVLSGDRAARPGQTRSASVATAVRATLPNRLSPVTSDAQAVERAIATIEVQDRVDVQRIARRDAIPLSERHVLVMWGMSTYRFEHVLGVTFVVDNSQFNIAREQQFREAVSDAMRFARTMGLTSIYLLE